MGLDTRNLSIDEVIRAAEADEGLGFCTACGEQVDGVEPDACGYDCEYCGAPQTVYGAEELLLMMM